MFGANRPPWTNKKDFYRTPFNYCDRWCKRCQVSEICKVFQDGQKARKKFIKQGRDPDSRECAFEEIKDNLLEVFLLLAKEAEKLGIDLDSLDDSDYELSPEPQNFPLYNQVSKLSKKLEKLSKDFQTIPINADEDLIFENLEIISHYRYLIRSKIYRALTSRIREEKSQLDFLDDSKTSAFIAINGFMTLAEALNCLAKHNPLNPLRKKLLHLGKICLDFAKTIDEEFNLNLC